MCVLRAPQVRCRPLRYSWGRDPGILSLGPSNVPNSKVSIPSFRSRDSGNRPDLPGHPSTLCLVVQVSGAWAGQAQRAACGPGPQRTYTLAAGCSPGPPHCRAPVGAGQGTACTAASWSSDTTSVEFSASVTTSSFPRPTR